MSFVKDRKKKESRAKEGGHIGDNRPLQNIFIIRYSKIQFVLELEPAQRGTFISIWYIDPTQKSPTLRITNDSRSASISQGQSPPDHEH